MSLDHGRCRRGVVNLSLRPAYAKVLLRHLDQILAPIALVVDASIAEYTLHTFLNICRFCARPMSKCVVDVGWALTDCYRTERCFDQYEAVKAS
jgi:hypothetical protein